MGRSGDGSRGRGGSIAETPRRDERLWGASAGNATGTPVAGSHPLVVAQVHVADFRVERGGGSRAVLLILRAVRGRGRERQSRGGDVGGGHRLDNARFARVSWRSARAREGSRRTSANMGGISRASMATIARRRGVSGSKRRARRCARPPTPTARDPSFPRGEPLGQIRAHVRRKMETTCCLSARKNATTRVVRAAELGRQRRTRSANVRAARPILRAL